MFHPSTRFIIVHVSDSADIVAFGSFRFDWDEDADGENVAVVYWFGIY